MREADHHLLRTNSWFGALVPARRELVLKHGIVRTLFDGTRLYRLGDPPNGLHALLSGEMRLISYPSVGTELVGAIIRPGQWFGELSAIDGKGRPHDAIAVGECRVVTVAMQSVTEIANRHPEFWRDLALLSCMHQRTALRDTGRVRSEPAIARLARFLIVARRASGNLTVAMTQDQIAQIIGISRQHLNKLVGQLKSSGLIEARYGVISLIDVPGSQSAATSPPTTPRRRAAPPQ